jgi:HlyD family secretion protein
MSLSSDVSQDAAKVASRGKVLKFPVTPASARRSWPNLKKYGLAAAVVAVVLVGGIVVGLWSLGGKTMVQYSTAPVARGDITKTVTATGTVSPVLTVIVGSHVSGVIQNLFCDYNTPVKAGQVCAKIDPRPYQATFEQYSGQLARDQAILAKDRANLLRYQKLAERKSTARQQAEDHSYLVNQDAATVELDQALVKGARLNLGYTDIVSPVDGTVVSRNVTGGQTVAASFQTPTLFLIAPDLRQMEVDTNTSEGDIGGVKVGDRATFTVDSFPQRMFQGAVTQVRQLPQRVQNVVTYDVVVAVRNDDSALVPGMTASTQIIIDQRRNVTRVPDQALHYVPDGLSGVAAAPAAGHAQVWVLRDGTPAAVPVAPGLDDGNYTEIVKGDFQPDDRVIIAESTGQASSQSGLPAPRL